MSTNISFTGIPKKIDTCTINQNKHTYCMQPNSDKTSPVRRKEYGEIEAFIAHLIIQSCTVCS
jgi:hypothetical protein